MIFWITVAIFSTVVSPSLGEMSALEFNTNLKKICFRKSMEDPYLINGQDTPLSNTLENFISLAEKLEIENPNILLKEELFYFIKNYVYENLQLSEGTGGQLNIIQWKPNGAERYEIQTMWEPDATVRNPSYPQQLNIPFSDAEKCSLYHMISHSIVEKPNNVSSQRSAPNDTSNRMLRTDHDVDRYYPQEIGVVAIKGTDAAVSLSRVLIGMYVGMNKGRKKDLTEFKRINEAMTEIEDKLPVERTVDLLYTLTTAEVLMLSKWSTSNRQGFAPNGEWLSTDDNYAEFCPMVYKQQDSKSAFSYSTVRGAADGLILGMGVSSSVESKKSDAKLSQILRMYYSREGIAVEQSEGDFRTPRISFCNRLENIEYMEKSIEQQMRLYGYLVSSTFDGIDVILGEARSLYTKEKNNIYQTTDTELQNYCNGQDSLDNPEDLLMETHLDVFVLMDSSISEVAYTTQKLIIGHLTNLLDLKYSGSRVTILLDHKINTASTTAKIDLKPVVIDSYSSSCAACSVAQIVYESSSVDKDQIILAIDQLLEERKTNESKNHGVNGKVVIFFNFETDNDVRRDNNKIQGRLEKALQDFHLRQNDAIMYAVGLETEILKKFARNNPSLVFLAKDGDEKDVAYKLYEKLSAAPALLQYSDCEDGTGEASATYENFVSPLSLQHWQLPAKYFYKSTNMKVVFESQNGGIRVCHNRATMRPENEAKFCMNTSTVGSATNNRIEFKLSNPCRNFNERSCAPLYFAIMGLKDSKNGRQRDFCNNMKDHWCTTLDDIKFKVSHQGIRCSGCFGRVAAPLMTLVPLLLSYSLRRMF